jgi:phage gpG-like protein
MIQLWEVLEHFAQKELPRQGYINTRYSRWPARQPGAERNSGRGLLTDSGHLRNSMRMSVRGQTIIIGNSRPYAKVHNEGGVITVTPKMRAYFWAMHYSTGKKDSHWKYMALATSITIPQGSLWK